jgi:hypothetical protein
MVWQSDVKLGLRCLLLYVAVHLGDCVLLSLRFQSLSRHVIISSGSYHLFDKCSQGELSQRKTVVLVSQYMQLLDAPAIFLVRSYSPHSLTVYAIHNAMKDL